jgi:DNA-binding NarL/FixJ family response regulator
MLTLQMVQEMSPEEICQRLGDDHWIAHLAILAKFKKEGFYPLEVVAAVRLSELTKRQRELYDWWWSEPGQTDKFYAGKMGLKPKTIHQHSNDIYKRLLGGDDRPTGNPRAACMAIGKPLFL